MIAMKQMILAVCLAAAGLVLAACAPGQARAAIYVVDQAAPEAADTNPGTEEKPLKTIQSAANVVKPGDTVAVMGGKYDERVKVRTSGTEGRPITLRAVPRRTAVVGGFDLEGSYLRIEGFEITAGKPEVAVQLSGSHCEVLDNYIHEMMMAVNGTYGRAVADGPRDYSAVAHTRIAYNKVYHSQYGFILGGEHWLVENNTFAGIAWCGVGLRGKESTHGQIRNNLFYDMQQAVLDGSKDDFTPANPLVEYNLV
jgi:hypothetical protein